MYGHCGWGLGEGLRTDGRGLRRALVLEPGLGGDCFLLEWDRLRAEDRVCAHSTALTLQQAT